MLEELDKSCNHVNCSPPLRHLLNEQQHVRVLETHSPLSAIVAQNTEIVDEIGNVVKYDAFWSSSLTDSTLMGKPDIEILSIRERLDNIQYIFDVTHKPLILDADTGGLTEHFIVNVKLIAERGVSAVIIEDKIGLKKNSLFGNDVYQQLDEPENFARKINLGKVAVSKTDLMIIARIESLILGAGVDDAVERANIYVDAGADGIMIHGRNKNPKEIIQFAKKFKRAFPNIPLVCVPTSFNHLTFEELCSFGFDIVIYANHMLRASYNAMQLVAEKVLLNGRTLEIEEDCLSIKEILELIPGTK